MPQHCIDTELLTRAVNGELWFLEKIDKCPGLWTEGNTLQRAIYRCAQP